MMNKGELATRIKQLKRSSHGLMEFATIQIEDMGMLIRTKVQRHLVVAHKANDNGEWIFTLCRAGLAEALGEKLRPGEEWLIELTATPVKKLKEVSR